MIKLLPSNAFFWLGIHRPKAGRSLAAFPGLYDNRVES